jgi:hypothetical protein
VVAVKFKVYAIQGMEFETLEIEAFSRQEAITIYKNRWRAGEVESLDYLGDNVEYVIEPVRKA